MQILLISRSYYPVISPRSFRTTELAHQLVRNGHRVTLMLPDANADRLAYAQANGINLITFGQPSLQDIDVKNGNRWVLLIKRGVRRLLNLLFEFPDIQIMFLVSRALKKQKQSYDLLISIAVPHPIHWGVALAGNKNQRLAKKWIADCGDPFMGVTIDTFKKAFYFKYVEKWFCRKANLIAVPIEEARKAYYPEFHSKIVVIPQGFDFSVISSLRGKYEENAVPTFIYAGSFIPGARDPYKLFAFLEQLDFDFKFIIFSRKLGLIQPWIKKLDSKLEIRTVLPREEVLVEMAKADFLLNINNNTQVQSPSKLIDYYLAGRPVLSISGNDNMERTILPFLQGDYSNAYQFKDMERYNIENVAKQFTSI